MFIKVRPRTDFYIFNDKYDIIVSMKLSRRIDKILISVIIVTLGLVFGCLYKVYSTATYAEGEEAIEMTGAKFVTFYDGGKKLTVRTEANTVKDALARADVVINEGDIVDPGLETEINADNFYINIYRARPVVVRDGAVEKYLMSASYDPATVAREGGFTIYDGDEIALAMNTEFLEAGVATVYQITRNGGRTITVDEEIAFNEEFVEDGALAAGKTEVRQLGEVGLMRRSYNVNFVDGVEVTRELVSEEMVRAPMPRITARGTKVEIAAVAATGTCADWIRAAGVAEADVQAALYLINHESGCRWNARNASSGAYGIPQALPGSKMASAGADWETNPITQIKWMSGYVSRYGGWQGAVNFWNAHGWY